MDFNLFDFQKPEDNLRKSLNPVGSALGNSVSAKVPFAQDTGVRNLGVRKKNVRTAPVESKEDSLINSFLSDSSVSETRKARLRSDLEGDLGKEGVYAILSTQGYEPPKQAEAKPEEKPVESATTPASSILPQEGGFIDTFNKSVGGEVEKVKRAIATPFVEAPRIGANIAGAVMDVGGGKYFGHKDEGVLSASEELKKKGEELTAKGESAIGLEGTDKTVARTVTDLASGLAIPGGFGSTGAKAILQAKNLSVPSKLGLIAAQGGVDAAKYSTVSRGDLTPTVGEVAISGITPVVGNVLKSVPKIAKFTGKSELLNNEAIRKGKALYKPGTDKIVGTTEDLKNALIRVGGSADDKATQLTQSAIGKIDTKDVNSYEELGKRLQTKIDELSETRRKALENETKLFKPDDSKIEYDYKGTKTVSFPVEEAFDDLKTVSGDDLAKVNYFKSKFYGEEGLSANELDDLAKLHKRYNNAFASTGEIKRSKSDLESTRIGIKSLISSTESGKNASPIDKELSPLLNLRDRVDELATQVDNIKAKIVTNYGEQAARLVTNMADLNKVRGLMKNLGGGGELKDTVASLINLDKIVGKNLEKIKILSEAVNQKNSLESIKEVIKNVGVGGNEVTRTVIKKPLEIPTENKQNFNFKDPIKEAEDFAKAKKLDEDIAKSGKAKEKITKPVDTTGEPVEIRPGVYREPKKSEVIKKPYSTEGVNRKIVRLTEKGGIKNVSPSNQIKLNQGTYKPVRVILSDKDKEIMEFVSFSRRTLSKDSPSKSELSKLDSMRESLKNKGVKESEAFKRSDFIKNEAKKVRSTDSETILNLLRKETPEETVVPKNNVIKKPSTTETVKKEVKKTPVIRKKNVPKPKFKT